MKTGFVYIWFDRKHKRYYIGSHWGRENDGYICSSRWMRNAYKRRPDDFRRRIITRVESGRGDLLAEEYKWLQMIPNEELGKRYYNLTNHLNGHWTADGEKALTVRQKISKTNKGNPKLSFPKPKSEEHRQKISATLKGRPLGYERTEETRQKISENNKRLQAEGKIGMSGKRHNDTTKSLMSANNAMKDPAKRAKIGEANRGKVGLWLNNRKKMAKPDTDLYASLLAEGYRPKQEFV